VQLSAMYHDVVKDRLYTDPAGSARRRSTQTALHRILTRLTQALAPILAFTADEAWEQIPGAATKSVHLSRWNPAAVAVPTEPAWSALFSLREQALPELEKARQAKLIGKGLDAVLHFALPAAEHALVSPHQDELRELCNCSAVTLAEAAERQITVQVAGEAGRKKCERCWHWELNVGENPSHSTLCGRCVEAVIPLA
jgi:isoleucyl-tRNA synthetase